MIYYFHCFYSFDLFIFLLQSFDAIIVCVTTIPEQVQQHNSKNSFVYDILPQIQRVFCIIILFFDWWVVSHCIWNHDVYQIKLIHITIFFHCYDQITHFIFS